METPLEVLKNAKMKILQNKNVFYKSGKSFEEIADQVAKFNKAIDLLKAIFPEEELTHDTSGYLPKTKG